ncbi:hypothetical protein Thimo_0646 [Thioflavicoccus mobilis 8321]|uniref:Uncharacterized protein n=1 Tax=Thioflavicoccus mobilis 8321 TaxID=765912 RepID=L0GU49_9GAMM|nr:hypothetical protein [Thioflavicoccus mobilis]AGA89486.1 hypothetical protein Thimo_0646 [Thioflavicoccus mobilis 8321]
MQNPLSLLNTVQIGKPGRVLVLHSDGYRLHLALVQHGMAGAAIRAWAESRAPEPQAAFAEALDALHAQGVRRLPKKAVLASAAALTALLELPVDPEHPRPREQMHELVRWELESLYSEQALRWTVGAALMGRGYLTPEQRAATAVRQAESAREPARGGDLDFAGAGGRLRFGDLAVAAGFVTRDEVEECVGLRDQAFRAEDQLFCGWAGQSRPPEDDLDAEDEAQQGFPWLAVAVPEGLRRVWAKACQRRGIFLQSVYPVLGAGFSGLDVPLGQEVVYLEVQAEQFALLRGRPGGLRSLRVGGTRDGRLPPEDAVGLCREELGPDIGEIHLRAPEDQADALAAALVDLLGVEVVRGDAPAASSEAPAEGDPETVPPRPKGAAALAARLRLGLARRRPQPPAADPIDAEPRAPRPPVEAQVAGEILDVARDVFGTAPRAALVSVAAQPPRPPLWQRRDLLPYAAAALVVLAVLGNDLRMRVQIWHNHSELARLDSVYEEQLEAKRIAEQITGEARRLEDQVAETERWVADLTTKVSGLSRLAARRERLPKVLERIAAACNDEMIIQAIKLPAEVGALVEMRGWALSNTAAQLFVANLNTALAEFQGTVRNSRIFAASGPRDLSGYQIEVWLAFSEGFGT